MVVILLMYCAVLLLVSFVDVVCGAVLLQCWNVPVSGAEAEHWLLQGRSPAQLLEKADGSIETAIASAQAAINLCRDIYEQIPHISAVRLQMLRAVCAVQVWLDYRSKQQEIDYLSLGWRMTARGLEPRWVDEEHQAQIDSLERPNRCGCTSGCSTRRCSCRRARRLCTAFCHLAQLCCKKRSELPTNEPQLIQCDRCGVWRRCVLPAGFKDGDPWQYSDPPVRSSCGAPLPGDEYDPAPGPDDVDVDAYVEEIEEEHDDQVHRGGDDDDDDDNDDNADAESSAATAAILEQLEDSDE